MAVSDSDDHAWCWRCGYSLFGFGEDAVCPECGLLVSIARGEPPLIIRSLTQKWIGIFSLVSFVPLMIVSFVFYLVDAFAIYNHDVVMYGSVLAMTLGSIAGAAASWFMKVPKREFSASACASLSLCILMFLWVWPLRILIPSSSLGSTWGYFDNMVIVVIVICALGSLSIQAKSFARKTGMPEPEKRHISFDQISYLVFVSVGLMALGGVLKVISYLIPLPDRLPGRSIGFGMLLGILPFGIWMICLSPILCRLARWPIGERSKPGCPDSPPSVQSGL